MSTTVTLVIHPNRTAKDGPPGWRYAIHVTATGENVNPGDLTQVANAGWVDDLGWAELEGQHHAKTAVHALRLAGITAGEEHRRIALDPFPPTD